ncbi:peptidase U32 family protein [Parabacteroides sp. FAFU027]|uniref:peptidase U32 family protein n=1 Tax=Parabacteroides sp. FAFU027 TaxID=2922715 RepID=UPI001FAFA4DA|nr:U32 family peptidase [Parabacteroides sp. FAFU027]
MRIRNIELLAPAKNADTGIEAIRHGADAVYIGAPQFSARAAAGNSLEEIERLVTFAHQYDARVYVALNTILTDSQLPEAEALIHSLYRIGVDAIIVQDMGILELNLPPIAIHASTQTDNRTVEKVKFMEECGFSQVVLARELTIPLIKEIASQTKVPLEVFVHGALCVSYSGQCYVSQAYTNRSANRGECAQFCRLPYRLEDANGKVIATNQHLLSLKDMNRSESLEQLLDAGVTSLKIEGRLKETSYVKNITAYYRKKLDEIISRRPEYRAASSGKCSFNFTPAPEKSFNRGFTDYYIDKKNTKQESIANFNTPKSQGEFVGFVKALGRNFFTVSGIVTLNNGDGLCFINEKGDLVGFRVNRVEDNRVFPAEMPTIKAKTKLYRNFDQEFERQLSKPTAERKINISIELSEVPFGFALTLTDENKKSASVTFPYEKQSAQTPQRENTSRQLSKLGNTIFTATNVEVKTRGDWFIPASQLAEWRRIGVEKLENVRRIAFRQPIARIKETNHPFVEQKLTYLANVANKKAERFYFQHQVKEVAPAFELNPLKDVPLMFMKHCVKYALGVCPVHHKAKADYREPLYLVNKNTRLRLEFDCGKCEMRVYQG